MSSFGKNLAGPAQGTLLLFALFAPLLLRGQTWERIEDFPGTARDDGVCFRIGNSAYCGTGLKVGWTLSRDLFNYDLQEESWESMISLPKGEERQYATAFSHDGKGYLFGGSANGSYLKDLWRYVPEKGDWKAMSPLPAKGRSGAISFCIGHQAYIIGGKNGDKSALREVWEYDLEKNEWKEQGKLPFSGRWRASGAAVNGKGYLLFGADRQGNKHRDVHEYHPGEDHWEKVSSFPGKGRSYSRVEVVHGELMIIAGSDGSSIFHNDTWRFDPRTEEWEELKELPIAGRRGGMSFSDCSTLYYSTGLDTSRTRSRRTWKYQGDPKGTGDPQKLICYPNPAREKISVLIEGKASREKGALTLFDKSGRLIHRKSVKCARTKMELSGLAEGIYLLRYKDGGAVLRKKLVKVGALR